MNAKTRARIDSLVAAYHRYAPVHAVPEFAVAVELALKETDRDTRHACAEAVSNVDLALGYPNVSADLLCRAHDACMNVQAI